MYRTEDLYGILKQLEIEYEVHHHPPGPTVAEAKVYWKEIDSWHCKNIFFRNHKGNRHYLVILEHTHQLEIRDLEQRLQQGKLSFASPHRLEKYLGVLPGSVTPLGLINDEQAHVHLFIDENLKKADKISFHPLINTASLVLSRADFEKFLDHCGNSWEYLRLYDTVQSV